MRRRESDEARGVHGRGVTGRGVTVGGDEGEREDDEKDSLSSLVLFRGGDGGEEVEPTRVVVVVVALVFGVGLVVTASGGDSGPRGGGG